MVRQGRASRDADGPRTSGGYRTTQGRVRKDNPAAMARRSKAAHVILELTNPNLKQQCRTRN